MARRPAASQAACGRGAWQWLWSGSDFRRLRRSRLVLNLRFRTDDMLPEGAASRRSATAVERLAVTLGDRTTGGLSRSGTGRWASEPVAVGARNVRPNGPYRLSRGPACRGVSPGVRPPRHVPPGACHPPASGQSLGGHGCSPSADRTLPAFPCAPHVPPDPPGPRTRDRHCDRSSGIARAPEQI